MRITNFMKPSPVGSWTEEMEVMANHIKENAINKGTLRILEAGCGTMWGLDLEGVTYVLTGVDIDKDALELRKNNSRDLDICILGDLRSVILRDDYYDVIYSSYVLEHIEGAERVMENFARWLKSGGIIVLRIPNRDSVRGFLTRITPFWVHVLYTKYVLRDKNAGRPGYAPFPTFFDSIVSRKGIYEFCNKCCLLIRAEYSRKLALTKKQPLFVLEGLIIYFFNIISLSFLSRHNILIYIIEKK